MSTTLNREPSFDLEFWGHEARLWKELAQEAHNDLATTACIDAAKAAHERVAKPQRGFIDNSEAFDAMKEVVEYLWEDEWQGFAERGYEDASGVFRNLVRMKAWLQHSEELSGN